MFTSLKNNERQFVSGSPNVSHIRMGDVSYGEIIMPTGNGNKESRDCPEPAKARNVTLMLLREAPRGGG